MRPYETQHTAWKEQMVDILLKPKQNLQRLRIKIAVHSADIASGAIRDDIFEIEQRIGEFISRLEGEVIEEWHSQVNQT